ncbi:hypothetical protein [Paenibacillus nasutitermitis]|uniref:Uncharacterized protein n=1 Tax=Paenibacillus nasutitermitis TaxID=1652958 RepID=A0A916YP51_9BACL|nr:hypothetical protein [Paenibacillus nasutitermitis]GGD54382.1 hypothetical protein GCM10010911_09950 [Paenibacillus nasutitermitis]
MEKNHEYIQPSMERKIYYVSVQSGSILQEQGAAAYELVISANEAELGHLQELMEELSSMDEAEAFHFSAHPYGTASEKQMNAGVDGILMDIYKLLYELGTEETKRHIETMDLFPEGNRK